MRKAEFTQLLATYENEFGITPEQIGRILERVATSQTDRDAIRVMGDIAHLPRISEAVRYAIRGR